MEFLDSLGSLFEDTSFSDVLGGLNTGAQILGNFNKNEATKEANQSTLDYNNAKLAEEKRQFDMTHALKQLQLSQGSGGGGGGSGVAAQLAIQRSNLLKAAYENASRLALEGRTGEAQQLNNILQGMNQVLLTRPQGAMVR